MSRGLSPAVFDTGVISPDVGTLSTGEDWSLSALVCGDTLRR
jgi:hypothetical protein